MSGPGINSPSAIDTTRPSLVSGDTSSQECGGLKMAVAIATTGRPHVLAQTLSIIRRQTRKPDTIAICAVTPDDLGDVSTHSDIKVYFGRRGLTKQRNVLLDALVGHDIITYFDDDFYPSPNYLAELEKTFNNHPNLAAATGMLFADGIHGSGYSAKEGEALLSNGTIGDQRADIEPAYNAYGCNMSFRAGLTQKHGIRFDEKLPYYGWLEDMDFSRQLAAYGDVLRFKQLTGVHLGTKGGRQSGRRLGYSQIANVVYLMRKGTCKSTVAIPTIARNVVMNAGRSFFPEPHIDRNGRLKGNVEAFVDLVKGQLDPRKIEQM